jgi:hypothetical protein
VAVCGRKGEMMRREVGLWIDLHKAVIVTVIDEHEETREIRSNIDRHVKPAIKRPKGLEDSPEVKDIDDKKQIGSHWSGYYDGIVSMLRNADLIFIFGPGDAKIELKKRLDRVDLGGRIVSVEAVNKMTDRQIVAKVRQHYLQ